MYSLNIVENGKVTDRQTFDFSSPKAFLSFANDFCANDNYEYGIIAMKGENILGLINIH